MKVAGIISAIVTPFSPDGESVNEPELRKLVDSAVASGLGGFVPCGGTGEFATLSFEERRRVVEVVVEQAAGRAAVIAQVGGTSTRDARSHAKHAETVGADAIMLATPYYEPIGFAAVRRYFHDVASATALPICIYNYPAAMGVRYDADTVALLMEEISTIRFIKDSGGDFGLLNALVTGTTGIKVFAGDDLLTVPSFVQGCAGVINGSANFIGPALVRMFTAAADGDLALLRTLWNQVNPLVSAVCAGHYNSGVKAACAALGFAVGPIRAPYQELTPERDQAIKQLVRRIDRGLMNVAPPAA